LALDERLPDDRVLVDLPLEDLLPDDFGREVEPELLLPLRDFEPEPLDDFVVLDDDRVPEEDFLAADPDFWLVEPDVDFCDVPFDEDLDCGEPLDDDPFDDPCSDDEPSFATPPTRLVATPMPSRLSLRQSVRRRPTGRPSTFERRVSVRGPFMCASLMCRATLLSAGRLRVASRSPGPIGGNRAIRPGRLVREAGIPLPPPPRRELANACVEEVLAGAAAPDAAVAGIELPAVPLDRRAVPGGQGEARVA
jgi:hypothetical protein